MRRAGLPCGHSRDGVPFDKGRAEERKALDLIPVRMSEENAPANSFLALGHRLAGQSARAGAAVKNGKVAVGSRRSTQEVLPPK